jgi:LysR family glycine cleavage system transcriptional activator
MTLPSLNALKTFEAAARHLSFKKAATELHVTPTAVSHQIQQLENLLGVKLFSRMHRGLALTDAAYECLPSLRKGFDALQISIDQLQQHRGPDIITIGTSPSFASLWLFPRLHRFTLLYPDFDVRVTSKLRQAKHVRRDKFGENENVQVWADETDVLITYGSGSYPDLYSEELMPLYITPLCSPRLVSSNGESDIASFVAANTALHDERGSLYGTSSFWDSWLARVGLPKKNAAKGLHFTHAVMALGAAIDGLGVVVSTPILAEDALNQNRLVAPFDVQVKLDKSYFVVTSHQAQQQKKVGLFCEWLRQEARQRQHAVSGLLPEREGR